MLPYYNIETGVSFHRKKLAVFGLCVGLVVMCFLYFSTSKKEFVKPGVIKIKTDSYYTNTNLDPWYENEEQKIIKRTKIQTTKSIPTFLSSSTVKSTSTTIKSTTRTTSKPDHQKQPTGGADKKQLPEGAVDRTVNGTWFSVGQERELYVYSAFLDDREAINNGPVVRLIAVTDSSVEKNGIFCQVKFEGSTFVETQPIEATPIGAGIYRHGVYFKEYVMICPMKNKNLPPKYVGITEDPMTKPKTWIYVQKAERSEEKMKFCSCVSATYWFHEPYRIVEWMELHRLYGVSLVTIYNNSLDDRSSQVFQHYDKEGFVDFRQSHSFVSDPGEQTLHMHMSPVINDCLLRNMHKCHKIVVTDLDEMVVPRHHMTYTDLIKEIDKTLSDSHPARSYTFRNSYFFTDISGDSNEPEKLVTLNKRSRLPPSPPGYSVKSIIDPQACTNMHNHYCWRRAKKHDVWGSNVDVNPDIALNQHYKKCHFDHYNNNPGECEKLYKTAVKDDIMLKYKDQLIKQVNIQLEKLGMELIT